MAEGEMKISELSAVQVDSNTLFEASALDTAETPAVRVSGSATLTAIANFIAGAISGAQEYTSALNTNSKTLIGAINEILASAGGSANANIAADFDTTVTYETGDFCIHNGLLHKYTAEQPSAGAWDSSKWTQTTVTDELASGGSIPDISNVVFPIVGGE